MRWWSGGLYEFYTEEEQEEAAAVKEPHEV